MARLKETGGMQASREAQRQGVMTKYGKVLGEAYLDYAHVHLDTLEEHAQRRVAFADAVVTAFESGTHEEKVLGIVALLSFIETKTVLF